MVQTWTVPESAIVFGETPRYEDGIWKGYHGDIRTTRSILIFADGKWRECVYFYPDDPGSCVDVSYRDTGHWLFYNNYSFTECRLRGIPHEELDKIAFWFLEAAYWSMDIDKDSTIWKNLQAMFDDFANGKTLTASRIVRTFMPVVTAHVFPVAIGNRIAEAWQHLPEEVHL